MRIKQLKAPPLLNAPSKERWWDVTADDADLMTQWLSSNRVGRFCLDIAQMHYHMLDLGLTTRIEPKDVEGWVKELAEQRRRLNGYVVASMLFLLENLGYPQTRDGKERDLIERNLNNTRADYREKNAESKSSGRFIAELHFLMRRLGLDTTPTSMDRAAIGEELEDARKTKFGAMIAQMHYLMGELGIKTEVTDSDREHMRKYLNDHRRHPVHGDYLAEMLHYLKHIMPPPMNGGPADIPPLRSFDKR